MLGVFAVPGVAFGQQAISLAEAMNQAAGSHPGIESTRLAEEIAEAQRKRARSSFGPTLNLSANAQLWTDELSFDIGGGGGGAAPQLPPPTTPYEEIIAGMFGGASEPTVIRGQFTWSASLTLTQPLTPLWQVYHGYKASQLGVDAARTQVTQAEREQARGAAVAYFRVLQARGALDTAEQSVARLEAQVERLEALITGGLATPADKLRIEVALAATKQQVSQARAGVRLSRAALAVAIGGSPQEPVDAQAIPNIVLPAPPEDPGSVIDDAIEARPEIQQLKLRMEQLDRVVQVQRGSHLPQLVAMAQYSHSEGQGLAGSDSAFVGLSLNWDIWKWGANKYTIDEAELQRLQLNSTYLEATRGISLQVQAAWFDLQSAVEAYEVASQAVAMAEEAYRIESVRYEAGQSTPTDLLDAQSALTEAQNNQNAAFYQTLIQNTELIYATGRPLTANSLLGGE